MKLSELRELAEKADLNNSKSVMDHIVASRNFNKAISPQVVIQLIQRIEKLTLALECEWQILHVETSQEYKNFINTYGADADLI
jgi:hypothetical protein